jgi:hypothetical protein
VLCGQKYCKGKTPQIIGITAFCGTPILPKDERSVVGGWVYNLNKVVNGITVLSNVVT